VLQLLINKVMADNKLDALVYPTKTVLAPRLAEPVEPINLKTMQDKVTVVVNGQEYERTVERVIDLRAPLTPRLSPNSGYPAIAVPAGFAKQVYDRAVVKGPDGSKRAGDFLAPKNVELPVSIDFLGRAFSEPLLIRIAAGYEAATKNRKGFRALGGGAVDRVRVRQRDRWTGPTKGSVSSPGLWRGCAETSLNVPANEPLRLPVTSRRK
jgi:amidase